MTVPETHDPASTGPTCSTCRYAVSSPGKWQECRRNPPTVLPRPATKWGRWPLVRPGWWCGEHRDHPERPMTDAALEELEASGEIG